MPLTCMRADWSTNACLYDLWKFLPGDKGRCRGMQTCLLNQCWDPKWYPIWDPKNRWDPIWDPKWYLVLGIPFSRTLPKIWGWDHWDGRLPSDFVYGLLTNEPWRVQKSHPICGIPCWDPKSHPKSQVGIPKWDPNAQHWFQLPIRFFLWATQAPHLLRLI